MFLHSKNKGVITATKIEATKATANIFILNEFFPCQANTGGGSDMRTLFYTDRVRIEQLNYADNDLDYLSAYRRAGGYYE